MLTDKETNTPEKKKGCDYSRLSLKELISRSVYDPKACWELFREGTEQNDRDAEVYLSRCEENIRNLSDDDDRIELYLKLADLYEKRGEREKSGKYYGLAGGMGDTHAQLKSAEIFIEEASGEADPAKKEEKINTAMQLLETLSESGTVSQKYRVAEIFMNLGKRLEAASIFEELAENADGVLRARLDGMLFLTGRLRSLSEEDLKYLSLDEEGSESEDLCYEIWKKDPDALDAACLNTASKSGKSSISEYADIIKKAAGLGSAEAEKKLSLYQDSFIGTAKEIIGHRPEEVFDAIVSIREGSAGHYEINSESSYFEIFDSVAGEITDGPAKEELYLDMTEMLAKGGHVEKAREYAEKAYAVSESDEAAEILELIYSELPDISDKELYRKCTVQIINGEKDELFRAKTLLKYATVYDYKDAVTDEQFESAVKKVIESGTDTDLLYDLWKKRGFRFDGDTLYQLARYAEGTDYGEYKKLLKEAKDAGCKKAGKEYKRAGSQEEEEEEERAEYTEDDRDRPVEIRGILILMAALIAVIGLLYFGWNKIGGAAASGIDSLYDRLFPGEQETVMAVPETTPPEKTVAETTAEETTAAPVLTIEALDEFDPEKYEKVTDVTAEATDTLVTGSGFSYAADKMTDGNYESSWQMRNEETFGVGERLTFTFEDEEPIKVIRYLGGNAKSSSKYKENYRPAKFTVTLYTAEGEFMETVTPVDRPDFQAFSIAGDIPVSGVVIEVTAVHEGTKYRDLCVTEVEFYR